MTEPQRVRQALAYATWLAYHGLEIDVATVLAAWEVPSAVTCMALALAPDAGTESGGERADRYLNHHLCITEHSWFSHRRNGSLRTPRAPIISQRPWALAGTCHTRLRASSAAL
jgi:hypothetical protein